MIIFHISYRKVTTHIKSRKNIQIICKKHIKNIIFRNFISKIKSESQNITNISDQKIVKIVKINIFFKTWNYSTISCMPNSLSTLENNLKFTLNFIKLLIILIIHLMFLSKLMVKLIGYASLYKSLTWCLHKN